ncbi:hypothetical protein L195_g055641, partial [Trifolium pratense]
FELPDRRPSPGLRSVNWWRTARHSSLQLATSRCFTGVVRQSSPTFAQRTSSLVFATVRSANSTGTATFVDV